MANEMIMNAWLESDDGLLEPSWPGGESPYHAGLRTALSPVYQGLPTAELDALVERVMASATPEDAEDFGSFLSDLGRAVAPIAAQVLPIAAPIVGTLIGGPAGTMVGQAVGRYAGQALAGATAPQRPVASPAAYAPPAAYTPPPAPQPAAPGAPSPGADTSSLGQLMALLNSPALRQLLAGQLLGPAGARTVPVGPESVPVSFPTMMEALSVLAGSAAESASRFGESAEAESTAYLRDASGRFVYDPAVPEERAAALVSHVRAGEAMRGRRDESVGGWLNRAGLVR